ncbi:hypothetical protein [Mycolicibacterium peregrinum]|uniref:Tetratricopeptide repeat protein n=1 Tax=Mycolicibacterium peregrinum TaxID=43304 RepID=A0A1A0VTL9_MYCPR|nr:hypothetical protein [Mycolicibacterium peregrinum]OBB86587.1 hypothetical protein A5779_02720 [Mycolicibacterium peregrinum]
MTANATSPDPTMEAITTAILLGRDGDSESARRDLLAIWKQVGVTGDPFHRCTLAHYLAELHEDPAVALIWDVRALDAAEVLSDDRAQQYHASLHVAGFYPSLHVNIADKLRRLGAFEAASEHINNAEQHIASLDDDTYGNMIRAAITEVRHAVDNRDTARRASAPGAAR